MPPSAVSTQSKSRALAEVVQSDATHHIGYTGSTAARVDVTSSPKPSRSGHCCVQSNSVPDRKGFSGDAGASATRPRE